MKKYYFLFTLIFFVSFAIFFNERFSPTPFLTSVSTAWRTDAANPRLNDIYDIKFKLSRTPSGTLNTYMPKYKTLDIDGAIYYFLLFGMNVSEPDVSAAIEETEQYFSCSDENGSVYVSKYGNLINYVTKAAKGEDELITSEEALKIAEDFIDKRFLFLSYEEAETNFDGETYEVCFINRIGNIKNYSFTTSVTLNANGGVKSLTYYNIHYQRLGSVKTISMETAATRLPLDLPDGELIELAKCSLAYIYEDSVVQPAYLFEGVTSTGDAFKCFINAASYG